MPKGFIKNSSLINSLGPIVTKVVNCVCNPEGLRNEKNVKKVTQEAALAGLEPPTFCLKALSTNHSHSRR